MLETTLFLRRAVIAVRVFVVNGLTDAGPKAWTSGDVRLVAPATLPVRTVESMVTTRTPIINVGYPKLKFDVGTVRRTIQPASTAVTCALYCCGAPDTPGSKNED